MGRKNNKQKALEYLSRNTKDFMETSYGPDCQEYHDYMKVVSLWDAERAIEIALGEIK